MKKITTILPLLLLAGCDGYYRYPCQDPANWGKLECHNDVCQAEGTCTATVLARAGTLPDNGQSQNTAADTDSGTTEATPDSENSSGPDESGINNTGCSPTSTAAAYNSYAGKGSEPRDSRVKNKIVKEPNNTVGSETIEAVDNTAQEVPLTMNTVVDTAAHNAATR